MEAVTAMLQNVTCRQSMQFKRWVSLVRTQTYQAQRKVLELGWLVTSASLIRRSSPWQTPSRADHPTWWLGSSTCSIPSSSFHLILSSTLRAEPAQLLRCITMTTLMSNTILYSRTVTKRGKLHDSRKINLVIKEGMERHKSTNRKKRHPWARVPKVRRTIKQLRQRIWWTTRQIMEVRLECHTACSRRRFAR